MTEETAKALTEAMNRLAAAIEAVSAPNGALMRGIQVYHYGTGLSPQVFPIGPTWGPSTMSGTALQAELDGRRGG